MALSPSFSTHSSGTMADIAARVVQELKNDPHPDTANLFDPSPKAECALVGNRLNEEEDFEFAFVNSLSPISADEIFSNGQIKPLFNDGVKIEHPKPNKTGRVPLRKLMTEERETTTSCSSDDLDSVPSGAYKKLPEPDGGGACRKRWKLSGLLHRSNSEGKDRFVFLSLSGNKTGGEIKIDKEDGGGAHFGKSRTVKEGGGKRRPFLGYKHDFVGILANVNGFSRNLRPF